MGLLSMPARAEIHHAMMEFTGIQHTPSEQHMEVSMSRQARYVNDTDTVVTFLLDQNPFMSDDKYFRNITSCVTARSKCNVDNTKEMGTKIIKSIAGKTTQSISFKRKYQTVTMKQDNSMKENEELVDIDPQLFFQRLTAVGDKFENTEEIFKYELCSYPALLFDFPLLLREATNPELANPTWDMVGKDQNPPSDGVVQYVLNGGVLLQRIPWG